MSRNSGGTYALPAGQPVVSGTTISATTFNTLTADLASEVTDSLSRSGKGSMTAPIRVPDGDQDQPGLSFSGEINTGFFRPGAASLELSLAGVPIALFTSTGLAMLVQTITTTSVSLAANWTGTVKRWTDTLTGRVSMTGSAVTGAAATDTPITLPAGSRPATLRRFALAKAIGGVVTAGAVTIDTDGSVKIETGVTSGTTYYFEISFLPTP